MTKPVQKFIVVLDPSNSIYFEGTDIYRNRPLATTRKENAVVFDTFDAARDVSSTIVGWGGGPRVEQITVHVEVADLSTPEGRIEVRNACTEIWDQLISEDMPTMGWQSGRFTVNYIGAEITRTMKERGLQCAIENRATEDDDTSPSSPVSVDLSDINGNTLSLHWEPMVDGFDYPMSGEDGCDLDEQAAQCEREPEPDETEMLRRQIVDSHHNAIARIHAVYLKSIAAADDVLRCSLALLDREPTAMCDGCEKSHPECDIEVHTMGDESMALCEQCKQRDHAHRTDS